MSFPKSVNIIEVGPRDGLQNEPHIIPTNLKIKFINLLSESGLSTIETTSFVSAKWIPQMADHQEVMLGIKRFPQVQYVALVPNEQGFRDAQKAQVTNIAVLTAASETFTQKNINCSIQESLERIETIITLAKKSNISVRGYISCALGCPYEGKIMPSTVTDLAEKLLTLGCYQISIGDTIGVGTPSQAVHLIDTLIKKIPIDLLAIHFHDTYGQALTNIYACLERGIRNIDSAVAGLGGCPYAPGASGNVATEDVIYLLNGLNISCAVDLVKLTKAGNLICDYLNYTPRSKAALALRNATYNSKISTSDFD